jgi:hypothetical protein
MLHFMEVASMNNHEIGHLRTSEADSPWHSGRHAAIGCAIEPTLCLFNHSCDANVVRINLGKATLLYAAKDIKEDQEVGSPERSQSAHKPSQCRIAG